VLDADVLGPFPGEALGLGALLVALAGAAAQAHRLEDGGYGLEVFFRDVWPGLDHLARHSWLSAKKGQFLGHGRLLSRRR